MSGLKKYFPQIREREELLSEIQGNLQLRRMFDKWSESARKEFVDMCTGARGLKILYDSFFKEIMNPEYAPQRLNDLLSVLLQQKVRIKTVLPNDTTRIADEDTLLVTDIIVELEDGSLANVEMQKIGYMFTGQRSACYSADLLLRQYKRIRGEKDGKKENFSYRDIKAVYTIVIYEKSPEEFKNYESCYRHYFHQTSDSGMEMELLQRYIYIPLDIFQKNHHNKAISNGFEAWLTFLSEDRPERIVELIEAYPQFKSMYNDIYELCRNVEKVMNMFSKELQELDKNTVRYMMHEMQKTIDTQAVKMENMKADYETKLETERKEKDEMKAEFESIIQKLNEELAEMRK